MRTLSMGKLLLNAIGIAGCLGLSAISAQAQAPTPASGPGTMAIGATLQPALQNAANAVGALDIGRWKTSRAWKGQLQQDVASIQQDVSTVLPPLVQAAQNAPGQLAPQLSLMHNVDALYDVLVRVSTAADLTGGREDAAALDNAVAELEAARKNAAAQVLTAATQRDVLAQRVQQAEQANRVDGASSTKTIVVDDTGRHTHHRRRVTHKKPPAETPGTSNPQ